MCRAAMRYGRRSGSCEAVRADLAMSRRDAQLTGRPPRRRRPSRRSAPRSLPPRRLARADAQYAIIVLHQRCDSSVNNNLMEATANVLIL